MRPVEGDPLGYFGGMPVVSPSELRRQGEEDGRPRLIDPFKFTGQRNPLRDSDPDLYRRLYGES